jgi:hypothetical protein
LLLNTAQAIDEAASQDMPVGAGAASGDAPVGERLNNQALLTEVSQMNGVEFLMIIGKEKKAEDYWGLDNPKPMATWVRQTVESFRELGERLQVGEMQQISGTGPHRKLTLTFSGPSNLCVGFPTSATAEQMRETMRTIVTKWAS